MKSSRLQSIKGRSGEIQAPQEEFRLEKPYRKKHVKPTSTSIRVTKEARDQLNAYRTVTGVDNISEAIEHLLGVAQEYMTPSDVQTFKRIVKKK